MLLLRLLQPDGEVPLGTSEKNEVTSITLGHIKLTNPNWDYGRTFI
jgi:hypothetical protein